jgi:hypothetical protein
MATTYRVVPNASDRQPRVETPSARLIAGIFFLPYVFSWATLQKGYRQNVRMLAFAWLLVCSAVVMPGRWPDHHALQANAAPQVSESTERGRYAVPAAWQPAEVDADIQQCVSVARQFGYRNGRCAHAFIDACLTGSRSRVKQEYEVDRMTGLVTASRCPRMPANYLAVFKRF